MNDQQNTQQPVLGGGDALYLIRRLMANSQQYSHQELVAEASRIVAEALPPAQPAPQAQGADEAEASEIDFSLKQGDVVQKAKGDYPFKLTVLDVNWALRAVALQNGEGGSVLVWPARGLKRVATPPSPVAQPEALPVQGELVGEIKLYAPAGQICAPFYRPEWTNGMQPPPGTKLYAAPQPAAARVGLSMDEVDVAVVRLLKAPTYPTLAGVVPFGTELQPFCRSLAKIVEAGITSPQAGGGEKA